MEEVVPLLYHYTSINSLRSIIESKSIWMTNILYQNDYEEYYHGLALVEEVLKSDYPGLEVPINFKEHKPVDVYTFSLSTEKDQLSQWRGYCPNGGCSFSFDANHHKNIMTSLYGYAVNPIKLGKVLYRSCLDF